MPQHPRESPDFLLTGDETQPWLQYVVQKEWTRKKYRLALQSTVWEPPFQSWRVLFPLISFSFKHQPQYLTFAHRYSSICFVTDNNFRVMIKKVCLVSPLKESPIAEVMVFTSHQRPTDQITSYSGIQKEDISEPYFNLMLLYCNIQAATIDGI